MRVSRQTNTSLLVKRLVVGQFDFGVNQRSPRNINLLIEEVIGYAEADGACHCSRNIVQAADGHGDGLSCRSVLAVNKDGVSQRLACDQGLHCAVVVGQRVGPFAIGIHLEGTESVCTHCTRGDGQQKGFPQICIFNSDLASDTQGSVLNHLSIDLTTDDCLIAGSSDGNRDVLCGRIAGFVRNLDLVNLHHFLILNQTSERLVIDSEGPAQFVLSLIDRAKSQLT